MDGTLITPKGGKKFPTSRDDWQWLYPSVPVELQKYHEKG